MRSSGYGRHWGPQSAAEYGDWYARNMYIEGHKQYKYHLKTYGHPSKFGFKDVIPTWKAERFDPDQLMSMYKKAGAKYFVSMGVHHDNFDLWDSKLNGWNAMSDGSEEGRRGAVEQGGTARRPAVRSKRTPGRQLSLVPDQSRRGQAGRVQRRAV